MNIPGFLVPDQTVTTNGEGEALELPQSLSQLELTLGIAEVLEQQSLDLSVQASPDGTTWGAKPIAAFPQKFYAGTSKIFVDLQASPEVRFIRAQWKVNRWGNWEGAPPKFRFFVFAEPAS